MERRTIAPYGTWRSELSPARAAAAAVGLSELRWDGEDLLWLESHPETEGRHRLMRCDREGRLTELTPPELDVRTRVHGYGGGAYAVSRGIVVISNGADGRLHRVDGDALHPLTPDGPFRYADLEIDEARACVYAIREERRSVGGPEHALVAVPLDGGPTRLLFRDADFISSPRLSPDGRRLVWIAWRNPNMPWDATELWTGDVSPAGDLTATRRLDPAASPASLIQPEWTPDGSLLVISDRSGWWNLCRVPDAGAWVSLAPMEAEFADPPWVFGASSYGVAPDGAIFASARADGRDRLYRIRDGAAPEAIPLPETTELSWVRVARAEDGPVAFVAAGPTERPRVMRWDPSSDRLVSLARSEAGWLEPSAIARPEAISFPTTDGATAHALFYRPTHSRYAAPADELPPLIVISHGGPTGNASSALDDRRQLFTSRGFAVVDVDYRGSSGYGRAYRRQLDERWGIVDVDDCLAAARHLVGEGLADPERLLIRGSSAGGYTTLRALTGDRADLRFAAGTSQYGVADLELLQQDTVAFEAHYLDRLVGPYPASRERYRARSPIHAADRLAVPLLLLQGDADEIVPPAQAERFVAALRARGLPHAFLVFEGEGHGFRRASTIQRALEAELSFYAQILGIELADPIEPVEIVTR